MTTKAETKGRSRLDPEPIARRDFLGMAALASAIAAGLFALAGALRLPKAAVLPSASKKFRVTLPDTLGTKEPFLPPNRSVVVFRDGEGVFALSTVCTHLGCIVKQAETGFDCPCHGSKFSADGSVLRGPAPKPLAWLEVKKTGASSYVVDEGKVVPTGTKVPA